MTRRFHIEQTSKHRPMPILAGLLWVSLLTLWSCGGTDSADDPGRDGGSPIDAASAVDGGQIIDADVAADARVTPDMGLRADGGGNADASAMADAGGGDLGPDGATGNGDGLYQPDDGPTHENGTVVSVNAPQEILDAIAGASPGDVITIGPGTYDFDQLIRVRNDGLAEARIFLRAEMPDTVTLNLAHIENFKIYGKYWIFENIRFVGNCPNGQGCEHAFHIVGDADDLIFRNNEVVNFASHVKLNGEVVGEGPARSFPDRTLFIGNFWHNTRYVTNNAPHNILNLDGGRDHVVRRNIFADYNTPAELPKSASAVYPKASAIRILIEQNLIVCEKVRTEGETARGIQLGDGAPGTICDGDVDQDGTGDCVENGQSQEAVIRNNIIMNCNNGGSATGLMVGSDRGSKIYHNTVFNVGRRNAAFYIGHADHETFWRSNILENGFNTDYAERDLTETNNSTPSFEEMNSIFGSPDEGDFSLVQGMDITEQDPTDDAVPHDFCGYPRGDTADRGAIEYSTTHMGMPCSTVVQQMYDRIP